MKSWLGLTLITLMVGGGCSRSIDPGRNYDGHFPLRKQTEYFDVRYRHDSSLIADIVRFDDAFIRLTNRDFFKADFDYPIRAFVAEDWKHFDEFVRQQLHVPGPASYGMYLDSHKLFATYETSGLGTFTHEIMHPLVQRNLSSRPPWAEEGIPTFFEKFYGYWKDDELVLFWGFQNPWRIYELGANLTNLDLRAIISERNSSGYFRSVDPSESQRRMVSIFLWKQGRFRRFLRLIAARDKRGYGSYFEAAMETPLERVIPLWQDYLQEVAQRRTEILSLPLSTVLDSQAAFESFAKLHGISTQQVRQQD